MYKVMSSEWKLLNTTIKNRQFYSCCQCYIWSIWFNSKLVALL